MTLNLTSKLRVRLRQSEISNDFLIPRRILSILGYVARIVTDCLQHLAPTVGGGASDRIRIPAEIEQLE